MCPWPSFSYLVKTFIHWWNANQWPNERCWCFSRTRASRVQSRMLDMDDGCPFNVPPANSIFIQVDYLTATVLALLRVTVSQRRRVTVSQRPSVVAFLAFPSRVLIDGLPTSEQLVDPASDSHAPPGIKRLPIRPNGLVTSRIYQVLPGLLGRLSSCGWLQRFCNVLRLSCVNERLAVCSGGSSLTWGFLSRVLSDSDDQRSTYCKLLLINI